MLNIRDLRIDPSSLGAKKLLVDVFPVYEYKDQKRTDTVVGYRYVVALPELALEFSAGGLTLDLIPRRACHIFVICPAWRKEDIMPRTKAMGRGVNGTGSIRKISSTRNGKKYTYWQARYTAGYDPGTGKQIQRSITGKTQKEVSQKLKQLTCEIDNGTYQAPCKLSLIEWLDIWVETYLGSVKPRTVSIYLSDIKLHINPALGAVRIEALNAPMIQNFYNAIGKPSKQHPQGLSAKTIKNVNGVLHKALQKAVLIGYLRFNPADACILPRVANITQSNSATYGISCDHKNSNVDRYLFYN